MADYIKKNILCQSYVHTETAKDFAVAVGMIRESALPLIESRAQFFLYESAEIGFDSEPGSVKSRITIFGTLILALNGIANYKDFRDGVIALYQDVQRVAEIANSETLFALKARGDQVKRVEVRTGIVGSLYRILGSLDALKADDLDTTVKSRSDKIDRVSEEIMKLIDNINDAADAELVGDELYLIAEKIPTTPTPGRRDPKALDHASLYRERRKLLLASIRRASTARSKALRGANG